MRLSVSLFIKTIAGLVFLFLYCEYLIYYVVLKDVSKLLPSSHFFNYTFKVMLLCYDSLFHLFQCDWPVLDPKNEDPAISKTNDSSVKVMVLADTHLLGSRKGHWFDKLRREWQMHRAFQTAMILHKPDLVFVLGDLTDEGLYCSEEEFNYYVKRFYHLFAVPKGTKLYVAVGNHDIGFHYG